MISASLDCKEFLIMENRILSLMLRKPEDKHDQEIDAFQLRSPVKNRPAPSSSENARKGTDPHQKIFSCGV
jgi:hypothetical protein